MARRRAREDSPDRDLAGDPLIAAYLREVEQMPEMTREGEIYLMKQIEAGKREAREAVLSSTVGRHEVLRLWERIRGRAGCSDSTR